MTFLLLALLRLQSLAESASNSTALAANRMELSHAVARADAAGIAKLFTRDAKFMVSNAETITGREAIQVFWQSGLTAGGIKSLVLTPSDVDDESGPLIVETGTLTTSGKDGKTKNTLRYMIVWKREEGDWKIHRDIANDLPQAPAIDRVGFPKDYRTDFKVLGAPERATDSAWILTAYGNPSAASITNASQLPYPNGSIILMEFAKATRGPNGERQKGEIDHIDVMRRGKGFGAEYGASRAGEWEFAGYRLDGSYSTPPARTATCAQCHFKAGVEKDFVYPLKKIESAKY